jgi:hypothetical protein
MGIGGMVQFHLLRGESPGSDRLSCGARAAHSVQRNCKPAGRQSSDTTSACIRIVRSGHFGCQNSSIRVRDMQVGWISADWRPVARACTRIRDSSESAVTTLRADEQNFHYWRRQMVTAPPPQLCLYRLWSPPSVKRRRCEVYQSPSSSAKVKNAWSYALIPPYAVMEWCAIEHRDRFTFTFPDIKKLS